MEVSQSGNQKARYLNFAITICILIVITGVFYRAQNPEYFDVVGAINDFDSSEECRIDLEVKRSWLYFGGPRLLKVSISHAGEKISSAASVHFKPTRIINGGTRFYHYEWGEQHEGVIVWSYFDLEIDRDGDVNWIEVGECASNDGIHSYLGYEHRVCYPRTRSIKCVPNNGFNTDADKAGAG